MLSGEGGPAGASCLKVQFASQLRTSREPRQNPGAGEQSGFLALFVAGGMGKRTRRRHAGIL